MTEIINGMTEVLVMSHGPTWSDGMLAYTPMAGVLIDDAKQKVIKCVKSHIVAIVDWSLVLERSTSKQHHTTSDCCIQPVRRPWLGKPAAGVECAAEVKTAKKMVDTLLLDESDVVHQRAWVVSDALKLIPSSLLNVDDHAVAAINEDNNNGNRTKIGLMSLLYVDG